MVSQNFFLTIKIIIFLVIVLGSVFYHLKKQRDEKQKEIDNFPPWTSECPDNWVKVENMDLIFYL